jgi:hypothetical protein
MTTPEVTREITFKSIEKTDEALKRLENLTGLSQSDTINRAVQLYLEVERHLTRADVDFLTVHLTEDGYRIAINRVVR